MASLEKYRGLKGEGRLADALTALRGAIPSLDANAVAMAGRALRKELPAAFPEFRPVSVLVLGQCTTSYLPPVITAWAWAEGVTVSVAEGGYDQILQDLSALEAPPDIIVLLPWHQRLLAEDSRGVEERVTDELAFFELAWAQVRRLKSKLIQVSHDWRGPGPLGYALSARRDGEIGVIQRTNAALRATLPAGAFFVDLESISAWEGKARCYDDRNYAWLKQPFSPEGLAALARNVAAGIRTLSLGRRKVLALDLDNTLWGGVVGEVGAHGIAVGGSVEGESYLAFQKHVRKLKESGILLAVVSKNNEADALEPFEKNDQLVLKRGDFAAFHASWDPKPIRLRQMAREMNLGLDSFVFFDDNPAEREHVRMDLPGVLVVEVPPEPAEYIRALQEALAFEAVDLTAADAERTGQYAAETQRRAEEQRSATPEEYLASLEMRAEVRSIDASNLDRVVDLISKTNQFNLTTRRHSRAAVEELTAPERGVCFAARLEDRFGDYGLISVVLATPESADTLRIDTWLMSCRAMGRTVEQWVFNHLAAAAREKRFQFLRAEFIPTAKNAPVSGLLLELGFEPDPSADGSHMLVLTGCPPKPTCVASTK